MDKELRESLMEWYLRFGERVVDVAPIVDAEWAGISKAFSSDYVLRVENDLGDPYKITPEGIEGLKNEPS